MSDAIERWKRVIADEPLLRRAEAIDSADVAAVASLRRDDDRETVAVALECAAARRKAIEKFGDVGRRIIADVAGIEQASGRKTAAYKANRIAEALGGGATIADLCCGMGGDAMALVDADLETIAVDRQPLRAWMTMQNCRGRVQAVASDVQSLALSGVPIHLDPARRNEATKRRVRKLEDYQPGPDVIGSLIDASPAAAIKLSPGIDVQSLPWPGEVEFISSGGRLVQAVLWTGAFAGVRRRATLLIDESPGGIETLVGEPAYVPTEDAKRYLYTFDASVERGELVAQLAERLDAPAIHPRLGLLTSDRVIESPWVAGFELIETLPWRPKRVKRWLASHDGGLIEVKTRGKACDPDIEQRRLRGEGATPYTVFVLRFDTKVKAIITKRLAV
jgi:hypothetical protein